MAETTKERLTNSSHNLKASVSRSSRTGRELSDYINPRGSRFLTSEANRNDRRNTRIIDSTGTMGGAHSRQRHDVRHHKPRASVVSPGYARS